MLLPSIKHKDIMNVKPRGDDDMLISCHLDCFACLVILIIRRRERNSNAKDGQCWVYKRVRDVSTLSGTL